MTWGSDIDKLLASFGNKHIIGKWCRKFDCFTCQFMFICPPRYIVPKTGRGEDLGADYILRNLTYGWPLDKTEFHKEATK